MLALSAKARTDCTIHWCVGSGESLTFVRAPWSICTSAYWISNEKNRAGETHDQKRNQAAHRGSAPLAHVAIQAKYVLDTMPNTATTATLLVNTNNRIRFIASFPFEEK
jgi:hypothetical protein